MGFKMETDFGLDPVKSGQYHAIVVGVDDQPENYDHSQILDGVELTFEILDGTTRENGACTEAKKQHVEVFMFPQESHRDGGKMCAQKLTNLVIALGLASESQRGEEVEPDWAKALKGQCVIALKREKYKAKDGSEKESTKLDGALVYGVDDPRIASVPKNDKALSLIPGRKAATKGKAAASNEKKSPPAPSSSQANEVADPDAL